MKKGSHILLAWPYGIVLYNLKNLGVHSTMNISLQVQKHDFKVPSVRVRLKTTTIDISI